MKIAAPNKNYTGISASVPFVNGIGETDNPHLIKWFREHGYTVEDQAKIPTDQEKPPGPERSSAGTKKAGKGKKPERKENPKVAPVQPDITSNPDELSDSDAMPEPDAMPDPEGE